QHQVVITQLEVGRVGDQHGRAGEELNHAGNAEEVLVEASEEKSTVLFDGSAGGKAELILAVLGLEVQPGGSGVEGAVTDVVEGAATKAVSAGFGDDVDDSATGPAEVRAVGVGRYPKLLHYFVAELVRSTVAPARLTVEAVVAVGAVHQKAGVDAAHTAK